MDLIEAWLVILLLYIQHTVHVKRLKDFLSNVCKNVNGSSEASNQSVAGA